MTNVREAQEAVSLKSRGEVVPKVLRTLKFNDAAEFNDYGPLNVVVGDKKGVFYSTNRRTRVVDERVSENELHCVSNAGLDTNWSKSQRGKNLFQKASKQEASDEVFAKRLMDEVLFDDEACEAATDTGCDESFEQLFSYIKVPIVNINDKPYGTRSATVILIRHDNTTIFLERHLLKKSDTTYQWAEPILYTFPSPPPASSSDESNPLQKSPPS